MTIRTHDKAGTGSDGDFSGPRLASNHNETLVRTERPAIAMLRQPRTTSRKEDRLELLVIRAGLRVGRGRRDRSRK